MPAIITDVTASVKLGEPLTIDGSGFGSTQGTSKVFLIDRNGGVVSTTVSAWNAASLEVETHTGMTIGSVIVVVQLGGESVGVRNAAGSCVFLPADPVHISDCTDLPYLFLTPGTLGNAEVPL